MPDIEALRKELAQLKKNIQTLQEEGLSMIDQLSSQEEENETYE